MLNIDNKTKQDKTTNVKSGHGHTSNIKSSVASSTQSNSRANSDFTGGTVAAARVFVICFTVLFALVGGRRDAEVAGRVGMRVVGVGTVRNVDITRPAAVAGRTGGRICDVFEGIGTTRAA